MKTRQVGIGFPVWMWMLFCGMAVSAQDAYEPDDSSAAAKTIGNQEIQSRSIHVGGNVDWAKFRIGVGGAQSVVVQATGDMQLWLIQGRTGAIMGYDAAEYAGDFPRIELASLVPGTYFIKAQDWGNDEVISAYDLYAAWSEVLYYADEYEPDNRRSDARDLARGAGVAQRHSVHRPGDVDWVKITVGRLGAWRFRLAVPDLTGAGAAAGDTEIWLYRADGRRVAYDDDSGPGRLSRISLSYLKPGTYYGRIQEKGNDGLLQLYDVYADWRNGDVHEPDNTLAQAARIEPIEPGIWQHHNLYPVGDRDWFQIRVNATVSNFRIVTTGTAGDTVLTLYNADGGRIAANDDGGAGRFSRIQLSSLAAGTYFAKVQEKGNDAILPYYRVVIAWGYPN